VLEIERHAHGVPNLQTSRRSPIIGGTSIALSSRSRSRRVTCRAARAYYALTPQRRQLKFTTPVALIEFRETPGVNSAGRRSDSPPADNDRIGFGSAFPTFPFHVWISANHVCYVRVFFSSDLGYAYTCTRTCIRNVLLAA